MSRPSAAMNEVIAAVDLGSNSFHMVVARYSHGQLVIIDRLREMVRLGAGVDEDGRLDKAAAARALACLERFGQRLRDMQAGSVRVQLIWKSTDMPDEQKRQSELAAFQEQLADVLDWQTAKVREVRALIHT